jgi:hypothetical protein
LSSQEIGKQPIEVIQKFAEPAPSDETRTGADELRRALMKRLAASGFVAPAVLSTLISQAAAQSLIAAPDVEN